MHLLQVIMEATRGGYNVFIEPRAEKLMVHLSINAHGNRYVFNRLVERNESEIVSAIIYIQAEIEKAILSSKTNTE